MSLSSLSACLALLALVPASSATPEPARVELRLANIPRKDSTSAIDVANRRVFEAFQRAHPEIAVRAQSPMKITGAAGGSTQFLAIAGGVAPDVFYLHGRKLGDYDSQGFLYPLNDFLAEYRNLHGQPYSGINAPALIWDLSQLEGRIIAVPVYYYSMALMARRDLFGRAGLPLQPPSDWEELYRLARKLTWIPEKEPSARPGDFPIYGFRLMTGFNGGWHMHQFIWSSGSEIAQPYFPKDDGTLVRAPLPAVDWKALGIGLSDEARYEKIRAGRLAEMQKAGLPSDYAYSRLQWRVETDDAAGAAVLAFYRRLMNQLWLREDGVEFDLTPEMLRSGRAVVPGSGRELDLNNPAVRQRIYRGVVRLAAAEDEDPRAQFAMQIGTLNEVSGSRDEATQWVLFPFPSRTPDIAQAAFIAGHYLGINATQRDPRVRAAAWKYITFVTSPEAQAIRAAAYVEAGLGEFIRPATLESLGLASELRRVPPERRALWDLLETNARVEPYARGYQNIMTRELGMTIDAMMADTLSPASNYEFQRDPAAVMSSMVRRVNKEILGQTSPEEIRRKSIAGVAVAAVILFALGAAIVGTVRLATRLQATSGGEVPGSRSAWRSFTAALFLAPAILSVLVWQYYPLLQGTVISFLDFKILGGSQFVGLRNFIEATSSPEFWRYFWQTLVYLFLSLLLGFFTPLILALLLHEIPRGKITFRLLYYLPAVTTGLVTLFLWKQLLYDASPGGLINQILGLANAMPGWLVTPLKISFAAGWAWLAARLLFRDARGPDAPRLALVLGLTLAGGLLWAAWHIGGPAAWLAWFTTPWNIPVQSFLQDRNSAMVWLIIPGVWAGAGPGCLVYLAALKGLSEEQFEAAELDGAGIWSKLLHVVLPNLSGLVFINLIGAIIGAMQASQNIFIMTGGGPEDSTMTVGLAIWYNAFLYLNFGLATAQAWILGAMLIGFTLYQLRLMNRMQFRAARI